MASTPPAPRPQPQKVGLAPRPRKIILDVDPGIGDALAVCLAIESPELEVVAITATGGNVGPAQATRNVESLIAHLDPPHWPRLGAADDDQPLRADNRRLWGDDGFCGADLRCAELHNQHASTKVLAEELRAAPGEVTIVAGGPLNNLAAVFQMEPDLAMQVGHLIIVGGAMEAPGDVTAAAEFNLYCAAEAAQFVFNSPATKTLLPLDVTTQASLTFDLLNHLPSEATQAGQLLRTLLPGAFQAYRQHLGLEGIYVPEAIGVVAALHPELLVTEAYHCEVETQGQLTHGATVIDRRSHAVEQANMDVAIDLDAAGAVDCILRGLEIRDEPGS